MRVMAEINDQEIQQLNSLKHVNELFRCGFSIECISQDESEIRALILSQFGWIEQTTTKSQHLIKYFRQIWLLIIT